MFKLLRHFSIASLISIAAASAGLSMLHRQMAIDELVRLGESSNAEITRVLANTYRQPLRDLLAAAPALSDDALRAHAQVAALNRSIRAAVQGTSVIKVKLYSLDGRTIYSSDARQIGENKGRNEGFLAARGGQVATELTRRDHFSAFEQQLEGRSVLSSYLPLRSDAQPVGAVFEVYQDITPFLANVDATQRKVVVGVVAVLLLLYAVLFLVVRRADRILAQQARAEIELVAARDAAEAGSQAKSNFLAVMSHEIRTPMNAVLGLLELLRLSPLDAEQRETVDTVRESGKSLLRLIDDVLDFSKIEAGKLVLQPEPSSLARLFESAHQTFAGVASHKGVSLTQRLDARIAPALLVDRLRLRQIVDNLLSNAIKFTERGRVELRAELIERTEEGDRVRISVRDTGIGIDADALKRLFEPFSQADVGVERRYGGTGLGLAICKRLAELMGTTIEVRSKPGSGSRIGLTLTLGRAEQAALHEPQPQAIEAIARAVEGRSAPTMEAARAEGRLVLVVDDHPVNRRMMARQLNVLGYAVKTAADGREALDHWRGGGFGLVLTDCQMPGMDGYQLAAAIRQAEARGAPRLPIVACTANVSREALDQCRAVGMDDALTKPLELAALKELLDRWLPCDAIFTVAAAVADRPPPLITDFATIAELAQGDSELQRDLLEDFRTANASDLRAAARAVHDVAIDDLRRAAHRIKGAATTVGAARLAEAATMLERAAQAGDWQRVSSAWAPLQRECKRLDERITAEVGAKESSDEPRR